LFGNAAIASSQCVTNPVPFSSSNEFSKMYYQPKQQPSCIFIADNGCEKQNELMIKREKAAAFAVQGLACS